ncbi:tigger transposable element-derived protein 3 [Rhinatrema bivittatum]|uniref:tigger transposable element-derived protein 3 n=1 Tax=Rhinatrema bivittatum TaxID=194408 RepID=UPI00112DB7DB|nr:tigger transposable element-derived protein 3 [Rhinatrema bivittatum]
MEINGKKKLHALSLAEKIQVLEMLNESKMSQSEVARHFQVSQPQISRICKNKEKLLADWCSGTANRERKRKRESKYSSIDEALLCWFHIARNKMWNITGPMLLQKAKELADIMGQEFIPSIGWLVRWKRRNNICFGQRYASRAPYVSEAVCDEAVAFNLPQILENYAPENVFGCSEIPLLYKMILEKKIISKKEKKIICILLCVNSSGTEKRKPVVVGTHMSPRCFFGIKNEMLPVFYRSSCNGWITPNIFSEWLMDFDREMGKQHRNVALILSSNITFLDFELHHIKLVFLPLHNMTLSPFHVKIVQEFKSHYKHRLMTKIASIQSETESPSISIANGLSILDAMHMVAAAWEKVSPLLIKFCFAKADVHKGEKSLAAQCSLAPPKGMNLEDFRRFVDLEEEFAFDQQKETYFYKEEEESDGSDCEELLDSLPTKADALKALGTLRRWFECNGSPKDIFQKFYDCEEEVEKLCCQ